MAECADDSCALRPLTRAEKRAEFDRVPANALEILKDLRDDFICIGLQYYTYLSGLADVEESLRDDWDELIHAARIIPFDSSEQDRHFTLAPELRDLGPLFQSTKDTSLNRHQEAAIMTSGEQLWTHLPFLAQKLQDSWTKESSSFGATERQILAALAAKLCATSVCSAGMATCAVWLFREALETKRPFDAASVGEEASPGLSVTQLLPAWLHHGKLQVAKLCSASHNPASSMSKPDFLSSIWTEPLALRAYVAPGVFSSERGLFWRQRLGDLYRTGRSASQEVF